MFNPLPIVLADLRTTRAGAIAVVLLIAIAVALGVAVSAQERALRVGSGQAADAFDILIGAPGSETQLVLSTVYLQPTALDLIDGRILQELDDNPEVAFASPLGFGDNYQGYQVVGVTPEFVDHATGDNGIEGATFSRIDHAIVGANVPIGIGDSFTPVHGHASVDPEADAHEGFAYHIVGRMPKLGNPWDRAILVPIEAVWWVHGLPVGHVLDEAALYPDGPAGAPDLSAIPIGPPFDAAQLTGVPAITVTPSSFAAAYTLRQEFRSRDDTMAVFPAEVLIKLYDLLGDVRDLVAIMSVLTQALVIGAILLAVLASLAQRRRLIGVLRALGASRGFVFATVWLNVVLMLTVGALLGLALGVAGAYGLSAVFEQQTGVSLPVTIAWQEVRLVLAIVVIGLVLATIPAALTYRGSVSAALRA